MTPRARDLADNPGVEGLKEGASLGAPRANLLSRSGNRDLISVDKCKRTSLRVLVVRAWVTKIKPQSSTGQVPDLEEELGKCKI